MFLSAKPDISLLRSLEVWCGYWFYKHLAPLGLKVNKKDGRICWVSLKDRTPGPRVHFSFRFSNRPRAL
jgi:hypothetical protein